MFKFYMDWYNIHNSNNKQSCWVFKMLNIQRHMRIYEKTYQNHSFVLENKKISISELLIGKLVLFSFYQGLQEIKL